MKITGTKLGYYAFCAILFSFVTVLLPIVLQAQEFKATIAVNVEQIPMGQRQDISTMQNDLESYFANQRFTGKDWEGAKVPLDITVYVTGGSTQSKRYTARLLYSSRANLEGGITSPLIRVLDKDWIFSYTLNQQLNYQTMKFEDFSTLIDFYNFIALGLDADTYEYLGGTQYFQQARDLCILGASRNGDGYTQTVNEPGEFTRISLVTEILSPNFENFRKFIYDYHVDGMGKYAKDPNAARVAVAQVLKKMAEYKRAKITQRSYFIQCFFDAKTDELTQLFKGTNNKEVLTYLQVLDPGHASQYEEAIRP